MIKSIVILIFISLVNNNLNAQSQWYPAIHVNKVYVRDTVKFRYPVTYVIEEKGKIYLYGRGTRYPANTIFDKKKNVYRTKNGIILTSRKDNVGYYDAAYSFKKIDGNKAKLLVKRKHEKEESFIYIKSLLPVVYPSGN